MTDGCISVYHFAVCSVSWTVNKGPWCRDMEIKDSHVVGVTLILHKNESWWIWTNFKLALKCPAWQWQVEVMSDFSSGQLVVLLCWDEFWGPAVLRRILRAWLIGKDLRGCCDGKDFDGLLCEKDPRGCRVEENLRSCCFEEDTRGCPVGKNLSGYSVEKDSEGLLYWDGFWWAAMREGF